MINFPQARTTDLVVNELETEVLIYDLRINKAYCLNSTSALVWQLCDGRRSVAEISRILAGNLKQKVSEDLIWLALDQFKKDNLLENGERFEINFGGLTRRQVVKKIGLASMVVLPLVSSLAAPNAAMAQSNCVALGQTCTFNNGRQGNCCSSTARCINNGAATTCSPCLTTGFNTNCNTGAGCCTTQIAFFSNSCCNGVTETAIQGFPNTYRCVCN